MWKTHTIRAESADDGFAWCGWSCNCLSTAAPPLFHANSLDHAGEGAAETAAHPACRGYHPCHRPVRLHQQRVGIPTQRLVLSNCVKSVLYSCSSLRIDAAAIYRKSTLLNKMTNTQAVMAKDALFATLDPTTRRVELQSGKQALLTDTVSRGHGVHRQCEMQQSAEVDPARSLTIISAVEQLCIVHHQVGFIQKLPTQLVAAFRATLEELGESTLLLHVVDVSSPNAAAQTDTVLSVLEELGIDLPIVTVWNKVDAPLGSHVLPVRWALVAALEACISL
jgi:50S ribosome-binding GTPase